MQATKCPAPKVTVTVRLNPKVAERLRAHAKKTHASQQSILDAALESYLKGAA